MGVLRQNLWGVRGAWELRRNVIRQRLTEMERDIVSFQEAIKSPSMDTAAENCKERAEHRDASSNLDEHARARTGLGFPFPAFAKQNAPVRIELHHVVGEPGSQLAFDCEMDVPKLDPLALSLADEKALSYCAARISGPDRVPTFMKLEHRLVIDVAVGVRLGDKPTAIKRQVGTRRIAPRHQPLTVLAFRITPRLSTDGSAVRRYRLYRRSLS